MPTEVASTLPPPLDAWLASDERAERVSREGLRAAHRLWTTSTEHSGWWKSGCPEGPMRLAS